MQELDVYLDTLYDGLEGLVYSPIKKPDAWESYWFNYPEQRAELKSHILEGEGDVYISPAVYSEKRATKDHIKRIQNVWVEFDGQEQIDFKELPKPTLIVQTSADTHLHCYWRTDKAPAAEVEEVNWRLHYYLGADYSGWDATQLLRPPGTFNHKRQKPVLLAYSAVDKTFALNSFDFVPAVQKHSPSAVVVQTDLIDPKAILREKQLPLSLWKMVTKEDPKEPYRSSFLARLALELAEEELTPIEIVSLLKHADDRVGKFANRSDQLLRLSQLADYAVHKHISEDEIIVYTPEYILNHVEDIQWILPGLLHTTGQLVLASAPAVGKTQLCMQLAYCLEMGERWLGYLAPQRHRPFFMSLEMDKVSLKYILSHQKEEWQTIPQFSIIDEQANWAKYENLIEQTNSTVLIIDSLTELMDESADNPNQEARRLMKWCRKVRRRYGVAIVLIHHNRKATEGNKKPKNLSDLAGSFLFAKDTDTVLQLWEDAKGIELSGVKVRFGRKDTATFMIERNEHLWFRRKDAPGNGRPANRTNPQGDSGQQGNSAGPGNYNSGLGGFQIDFGNRG